jgi:hypothetical protein
MKRIFLIFLIVMMVIMIHHARRSGPGRIGAPRGHERRALFASHRENGEHPDAEVINQARGAIDDAKRAIDEARREARKAIDEARREARHAIEQARREVRQQVSRQGATPADPPATETAAGLPVPIVPGTLVTIADTKTPETNSRPERAAATRSVVSQICATEERAKADGRKALDTTVAEWLLPEVPTSWTPPAKMVDALVKDTRIQPVVKDYGTLYVAELTVDSSAERRAALVDVYQQEQVTHRLTLLGGGLAFALICLAAISGYIRTDEATKGYYTNRLKLAAAAGVGAAGVLIYQVLA